MTAWLDPVRRTLDESAAPVAVFFRDDDAGWQDLHLAQLLDTFAEHSQPVDVAVIPDALTSTLARELRTRAGGARAEVALHQHGRAHLNHEPIGRKCEFGASRSFDMQRRDIERGRRRLHDLLGREVHPIFTPPWNRCTAETGRCLVDLGFRVLSRDASAPPLGLADLIELPVQIDWFARRHGVRLDRLEWGAALARSFQRPLPIGIMLHHALMDDDDMAALGELLAVFADHERVDVRPMMALVPADITLEPMTESRIL